MSTTKTAEAPQIYAAMAGVMRDIKAITKSQQNEFQKFWFRGIDDVMNSLHPIFSEHGLIMLPSVEKCDEKELEKNNKGNLNIFTQVTVRFRFIAMDGSFVEAVTVGGGMDYGDKSTSKAMTAAYKTCLLESFMIPTEDTVDADSVDPHHGNRAQEENGETVEVLNERAMVTERARMKRLGLNPEDAEPMEQRTRPLKTVKTPTRTAQEATEPPEAAFKNVVLTKLGHAAYKNKRIGDLSLEDLKTIQSKWVLVKAGIIAKDPIAQAQADAINEAVAYYKQGDV